MEVELAYPSKASPAGGANGFDEPSTQQQRSGNTRSGHTSLQQKRPAPTDGSKVLRNDEVYRQLFEAEVQLTDQLAGTRWWRENKPAVKQVKSTRDLSLPVVRNAPAVTTRGMLGGRQAEWTRALENDAHTENPVTARQAAEWLDLVSAETESGKHANEVADLPDQVRSSRQQKPAHSSQLD